MAICPKCGSQNAEDARFCSYCAAPLAAPQMAAQPQTQQGSSLPPQLQPGQKATLLDYLSHYQGLQYHWAKRLVAIILDSIFIIIPVYVFMTFVSWWVGGFLFIGIGGIVLFLYSALFEYAAGHTIGKAIMGLKVVSMRGKVELPDAMLRNITKIYGLILLIEFIATLFVETTDAHQRYTDKLAKTTVIEKRH